MRAIVVRTTGGPETLELVEVSAPTPGIGQVRIRVDAAAVNPVDAATRSGNLIAAGLMSPRETIGIGWDVAGTIDKVGPEVAAFSAGDRVIGVRDRLDVSLGTYAEFVVLDASAIAIAPTGLSAVEASTLPLNGLTALQGLDLLDLDPGATVLVTGAAGAVGGFAVELAAERGLRTVGYASSGDEEFVRSIGAQWFIPRSADLAETVRGLIPGGVDGVLDAAVVGIPALGAVRNRGAFVSVVAGGAPVPLRGITVKHQWIAADATALEYISSLAETGRLSTRVAETLPLDEAGRAHQLLDKGGLRGRLVLTP